MYLIHALIGEKKLTKQVYLMKIRGKRHFQRSNGKEILSTYTW